MSKLTTTKNQYINLSKYIKTLNTDTRTKFKLYLSFKYKTDKFELLFLTENEITKIHQTLC